MLGGSTSLRLSGPIVGALLVCLGVAAQAVSDAQEIVERADRIRFPENPFQVAVKITTVGSNGDSEVRRYRVLAKGTENSIVQTLAPASERGQIMLTKGHNLWVFLPAVSQPVRLPLSQRLTGQVANGDLARVNFAGDYNAQILRTEQVDGASHYVLELTAVNKRVTYHRVLYWVNKDNYRPHKAEFYTLSGRLTKVGYYREYGQLGKRVRPRKLVLVDALREGERSILEYSELISREIPDKVFSKQYLKKLM